MTNRLKSFRSAPLWGDLEETVVAGPCSAETQEQTLSTAKALHALGIKIFRAGVWKPRTYPGGFEGVGEVALDWLLEVRSETGMLIGTEVGTAQHVALALEYQLDFIWLGARTTASPFAVSEIADALRGSDITVLVKNPLSPSIDLWKGTLLRLIDAGITRLGVIHRGFDIGTHPHFRNTPLWDQIASFRADAPGIPILLDPSHIAGNRAYIRDFIQLSNLLQYNGLMIESHMDPDHALSDRRQQVTPLQLGELLTEVTHHDEQQLTLLRDELNQIDEKLLLLLSQRRNLSLEIGKVKERHGFEPYQEVQYQQKRQYIQKLAEEYGIPRELSYKLYELIHKDSIDIQKDIL